jgi:hypothetical protein
LVDRTLFWDLNQSRTFDYVQDSKDTLKAIAQMMGDVLGETTTVIAGLAATASSPASLSINLAAGAIYQLAPIDATANGAFAQDTTQVLQQGIIGAQTIVLSTAGISAGRSQWQLIEAQFSQTDIIRPGDPNGGLLFFFDADNVSQPFQGPGGAGTTTPTVRQGIVTVQVITGAAAATGSEVPPQPTPGWTPLYLVDLSFGQTQITQTQIQAAAPSAGTGVPNTYPYAPFLAGLLDSHHGGVPGQAPKIDLAREVTGLLPLGNMVAVRTVVFGPMTIYVNPNPAIGSDVNNGLSPSAPFRTIQAAINTVYYKYDFNGNPCNIQCADGTYAVSPGANAWAVSFSGMPMGMRAGQLSLTGNTIFPQNCVISVSNGNGVLAGQGAYLVIKGFTIAASGNNQALFNVMGYGILADSAAYILMDHCIIGSCGTTQISQGNGGIMTTGNGGTITLTGSTQYALLAQGCGGQVWCVGATFTVTGLNCAAAFANATCAGVVSATAMTFIGGGTVTGPKFVCIDGGTISVNGGGINYFPGSAAGTNVSGYYG